MDQFNDRKRSHNREPHRFGDLSYLLNEVKHISEAHNVPFEYRGNVPGTKTPRSSIFEERGTAFDRSLDRRVVLNIPSNELGEVAWSAMSRNRDFAREHETGELIVVHLRQNPEAMWDYHALVQRQNQRGRVTCEATLSVTLPEEDKQMGVLKLEFCISESALLSDAGAYRILDSISALHRYVKLLGLSDILDVTISKESEANLKELMEVSFDSDLIPESIGKREVFERLIPANYPVSLIFNGRFPSVEFLEHKTIFRIPTQLSEQGKGHHINYALQECKLGLEALRSGVQLDVELKYSDPPSNITSRDSNPSIELNREVLEEKLGHMPSEEDVNFIRELLVGKSEQDLREKFRRVFEREPTDQEIETLQELKLEVRGDENAESIGELAQQVLDNLQKGIEPELKLPLSNAPHHYRGLYFELEFNHGDELLELRILSRKMLAYLLFAFREHLDIPPYLQKLAFRERFDRRV